MNCIFCKIASKELPCTKIFENEKILAFRDLNPSAPVHILVIPKDHISSGAADITPESAKVIAEIFAQIPNIAGKSGLQNGFRVVTNSGEDAEQSVPHLHFHLLGGRRLGAMVSDSKTQ